MTNPVSKISINIAKTIDFLVVLAQFEFGLFEYMNTLFYQIL